MYSSCLGLVCVWGRVCVFVCVCIYIYICFYNISGAQMGFISGWYNADIMPYAYLFF